MATTTRPDLKAFEELDARTIRALTGVMQVVEEADDLYSVHSGSGNSYTVDLRGRPACDCPDFQNRDVNCKHIRRCYFATGKVAISAEYNLDALDDMLLDRVENGDARVVAADGDGERREIRADGGVVEADTEPEAAAERAAEAHADNVSTHTATDEAGQSYTYFRCESCGLESTDPRLKRAGCFRCPVDDE